MSQCALEARRKAIALSGELQERGMQCLHGCAWPVGRIPENHRASGCALECCLEGFGSLDGHKLMPSRERICPGVLSGGVRVARWTQIDAIARADVPCRPVEWRLPCQVNFTKVRNVCNMRNVCKVWNVCNHPLLLQSTRVQECRADYDLKANSKPI